MDHVDLLMEAGSTAYYGKLMRQSRDSVQMNVKTCRVYRIGTAEVWYDVQLFSKCQKSSMDVEGAAVWVAHARMELGMVPPQGTRHFPTVRVDRRL